MSVVPEFAVASQQGEELVRDIRGLDVPLDIAVEGQAAELVDTKASIADRLPLAMAIIVFFTFILLFMLSGSLLVPVKALVLNFLSLTATFGAMVWIFQDGNLSDVLGFTATGAIDITMPILMFCIAFGLSMDYEVFLLSRIKEEHDRTERQRSVSRTRSRTHGKHRHRRGSAPRDHVLRLRHVRRQLHQDVRHRTGPRGPDGRHRRPRLPRAGLHAARRRGQLVGPGPAASVPRPLRRQRERRRGSAAHRRTRAGRRGRLSPRRSGLMRTGTHSLVRTARATIGGAGLVALLAACNASDPSGAVTPGTAPDGAVRISIDDDAFTPTDVEVPAGRSVTLEVTNRDGSAHDFAIRSQALNTGTLEQGQTATALVQVGNEPIVFVCTFHDGMKRTAHSQELMMVDQNRRTPRLDAEPARRRELTMDSMFSEGSRSRTGALTGFAFALVAGLIVAIGVVHSAGGFSVAAANPVDINEALRPVQSGRATVEGAAPRPDMASIPAASGNAMSPVVSSREPALRLRDEPAVVFDRLVLVGDSLAEETASIIEYVTPDKTFVRKFYGGTAPCDWIDDDLEATPTTVVVITFTGNNLTPCMLDSAGAGLIDQRLVDKYRADVGVLIEHATAAGAWVVLVGQPLRDPRFDADYEVEGINRVFQEYAAEMSRVSFVDAGRFVETPEGRYADRLACIDLDTDCAPDGTTVVRGDGVHFCPVVGVNPCPVWSSGAVRFGLRIASAANDPSNY